MMKSKFDKDGVILINKERGITSFSVVNKLKKILNAEKTGHAGTLDPLAEGLLIVMINNATRFSDDLMKKDKTYYVEFILGYETDTYDMEGRITESHEGNIDIPEDVLVRTVKDFVNEKEQIPPMYSAVKVKGEKLYNLARKGIEIERKPRKIRIYSIEKIEIMSKFPYTVSFSVKVSSGTYIRSLIRDIGQRLGTYATMTRLIRTESGKFSLEEAISLEEAEKNFKNIETISAFKKIETLFNYEKITISEEKYRKLKNGMTVTVGYRKAGDYSKVTENKLYCIYTNSCEKGGTAVEKTFKGIVQVTRKSSDKVYLKRYKYFL